MIRECSDERRRGRPRSARADRAILSAALALLAEQGFEAMSIEGIAERAGVGKTTIYRRFSSKEDIVVAAIETLPDTIAIPDTGDTRSDMVAFIRALQRSVVATPIFPVMSHVIGAAIRNRAILEAFNRQVVRPRQRALREILERGIERGDVRADVDLDLVVDMMPGTIFFRLLFKWAPGDLPPERMGEMLVNELWQGLRAAGDAADQSSPD